MKTTIEIADDLLLRAKEKSQREQTTLRNLVEEGLRLLLEEDAKEEKKGIDMTFGVVAGQGFHPSIQDGSWKEISELIYPTEFGNPAE